MTLNANENCRWFTLCGQFVTTSFLLYLYLFYFFFNFTELLSKNFQVPHSDIFLCYYFNWKLNIYFGNCVCDVCVWVLLPFLFFWLTGSLKFDWFILYSLFFFNEKMQLNMQTAKLMVAKITLKLKTDRIALWFAHYYDWICFFFQFYYSCSYDCKQQLVVVAGSSSMMMQEDKCFVCHIWWYIQPCSKI